MFRVRIALDELEVFPWSSNFETGIAEIDLQHRELVRLLNKLAVTLIDDDNSAINSVFEELVHYADYHFQTEERIWSRSLGEDDWLVSHRKSHADFLPRIADIRACSPDVPLRGIVERVVKFLIGWLAFHIIDSDRRMAIAVEGVESGNSLPEAKRAADERMSGSFRILIDTILAMYDGLSSRTLELMRERIQREEVEQRLREANRKLETLAITDVLTGLHNRRHFDEIFPRELRRAKRDGSPLALLFLDIDYFKRLNDSYGHAQGDRALAAVGGSIRQSCQRPGDFCFRLGGEEFAVIISNASSAEQVRAFSERLRQEMMELRIPNVSSDLLPFLTISIGVLFVPVIAGQTVEALIKMADDNLYKAKHQGRNRVVISNWQDGSSGPVPLA